MNLKILLPFGIFASLTGITRIVAETREGSFGILPHRRDCVAALTPGILTYTADTEPTYLAADEGVLVKQGSDVTVAIRHCIRGTTLALLHEAVKREFLGTNAQDRAIRQAFKQMESGLLGGFVELHRDR
jgi:F-type H+-transporting ATPase subunit epsilon